MKRVLLFLFFSVALVLFFAEKISVDTQKRVLGQESTIDATKFYDAQFFLSGVSHAKKDAVFSQKISGGIIPHHIVAGVLLSDFFQRLSAQKPKTILLIGPNHEERGIFWALTSFKTWATPFGNVQTDIALTSKLVAHGITRTDDETVGMEHSVGAVVPYVAYYLPGTTLVALVVSNRLTSNQVQNLGKKLAESFDPETTVAIAPVDFSHYEFVDVAQKNDVRMVELLRGRDYRTIMSLGNDYLDGPSSVVALLNIMDALGKKTIEVLGHSNSAQILGRESQPTTSYFTIVVY